MHRTLRIALGVILMVLAFSFFLTYLPFFLSNLQQVSFVNMIFGTVNGLLLALTAGGVYRGYRLIKSGV
jgi:hypothetical protein